MNDLKALSAFVVFLFSALAGVILLGIWGAAVFAVGTFVAGLIVTTKWERE